MPDIDRYDNNDYKVLELPQRQPIIQADYDKQRKLRDAHLSNLSARGVTPPLPTWDSHKTYANDWSPPRVGGTQ